MSGAKEKGAVCLFSGELDRAMAAFIIATGAASMGVEVTMFFTFWGLNCIRRSEGGQATVPAKSAVGKALGLMNPGGADRLPLTHLDLLGVGRKMMRGVMKKKGIAALPELMDTARELGVRMVACQMSMEALEVRREEFLYPEIEVGGVATFVGQASAARFSLFI